MSTVTLRRIKLSGGRVGLYADTYPAPEGKSRLQSLGLRISARPAGKLDKEQNKEQINIALQICRRKENEIAKPEVYTYQEKETLKRLEKGNQSFGGFCMSQISKMEGNSYKPYKAALEHFFLFLKQDDIKCGSINLLTIDEFRDYLPGAKKFRSDAVISQNSAATYMAAFKSLLVDAYKAELIAHDLGNMIDGLSPVESTREFLSIDEVRLLQDTECSYPGLKEMSLFSILTGMRFSDISKLDRNEIKKSDDGYYLDYSQQKTGTDNNLPISDQAYNLIPAGDKPFESIDYNDMQRPLRKWVQDAGIEKHITFHSFRHTCATLLISNDVDIFTVSKILGHKSVKSTQVYTKVVDQRKVSAVNKIII